VKTRVAEYVPGGSAALLGPTLVVAGVVPEVWKLNQSVGPLVEVAVTVKPTGWEAFPEIVTVLAEGAVACPLKAVKSRLVGETLRLEDVSGGWTV